MKQTEGEDRGKDGSGQREGEWEGDSVDLVTGFSLVLVN